MKTFSFLPTVIAAGFFLLTSATALCSLPAGYEALDANVRGALASAEALARTSATELRSPLSAEEIAKLAAARNPEALEALTRVRKELIGARKELGLPDLNAAIEARDFDRIPGFNSMQGNMFSLSRMWPLGDKLSRRALIRFREAEKAFQEYETVLRNQLRDARVALAEVCSAERQIAILDENISLLSELAQVASARYATGQGGQQDILKAETEVARQQNDRLEMERMAGVARAMVNQLLARPATTPLPALASPPTSASIASEELLEAAAQANLPELKAARAGIERARAERDLALSEKHRPDLTGQVGVMQNPEGTRTGWQAMVAINLPWFSKRRDYEVTEMATGIDAENRRYEAVWNKARFDIRESMLRVQEAARSVALFRDRLLPVARQALASARAAYETSLADFLSLIDAQRALRDVAMGQARASADLARRAAELERALGAPLARTGK